jgi:hypothetical protein
MIHTLRRRTSRRSGLPVRFRGDSRVGGRSFRSLTDDDASPPQLDGDLVAPLQEQRGKSQLGMPAELGGEGSSFARSFHGGVEGPPLAHAGVGRVPRLTRPIAQLQPYAAPFGIDPPHEEGGILDRDVDPVVPVRENKAAIVGVAAYPCVHRTGETWMLDLDPVVKKAPLSIQGNRTFPRRPFGGGEAEELGVIAGPQRSECGAGWTGPQRLGETSGEQRLGLA